MLKAMRSAFEEARKHPPSLLFVSEFDSVGSRDEGITPDAFRRDGARAAAGITAP
ncbi:hypothetical protein GCM10011390_21320 [Aureimonas endophytica]|uniref:ATPase family protein associated with various cellular activities (AAA) n=2 Tax=Aureimonas endophytica TaxID=2027858 RepID=A0A916ZKF0_9HYPH|nr:hypothetical protein [Aureimonas endophytica]GGE02195.1 hypothetical protein GCM10011390_21320 [Aureimonas endophytica]